MRISAVPLELRYKQLASLGDEAGSKEAMILSTAKVEYVKSVLADYS
jgi:hypothetical protein